LRPGDFRQIYALPGAKDMSVLGGFRAGRLVSQWQTFNDLESPQARKVVERLRNLGGAGIRSVLEELQLARKDDLELLVNLLSQLVTDKTLTHYAQGLASESDRAVQGIIQALGRAKGYNANKIIELFNVDAVPKAALCEIASAQKERLDVRRVLTQAYLQEPTEKAALFRIVADVAQQKDTQELISRLTGKDIVAKAHIIDILSGFETPEVLQALETQLKNPNKLIRRAAITSIGKMDTAVNIPLLCELLCDSDMDVMNKAADVLIRLNHPDTVRHLVVALKDESEYARRAAVEVLNEIGDTNSVKDLLDALGDDDWWVRARATDALAKIGGPRVVTAVLELIKDEDEEIRRAAIEILNVTKDERAVKKLIEATGDDDWWVRERAADALAAIGNSDAIPALLKMLEGGARSIPSAIRGLAKLGDARHVPALLGLLSKSDKEIQIEAMDALPKLADTRSFENVRTEIAKLLDSEDRNIRQSAIAAVNLLDELFSPDKVAATEETERFREPGHTLLGDGTDVSSGLRTGAAVQNVLDITALTPGSLIEGRYEFIKKIGKGAFGTVLLVNDRVVDENLILKFLNPDVASDEEMIKRFVHELRYSRKITHKNVIRIYDFLQMGSLYAISMEYFPSHTLGDETKDDKPLPIDRALQYTCDIATGMIVAHQAGIIHRDLKPANILIDDDGLLKIVDFGVAAARTSGDTQLTKTGYVIGSPKYMAPEQILGKEVDERADIYSLGVMMYEMLTGAPPYSKGDQMSVMYQHVQGKAPPPREVNKDIPEELSDCVVTCMSVDKNKRYVSMDAVHDTFVKFLPAES
jgi:serine/threonine-protein kinase